MKRIILGIIIMLSTMTANAQYEQGCAPVQNFIAVSVYGQPGGIGMELGMWPVDFPLGGFIGGAFLNNSVPFNSHLDDMGYEQAIDVYIKPVFRLNRYVYTTATFGAVSMEHGYISGGLRLVMPVNQGSRFAFIAEPQYGTRGFNIQGGASIALH